MSFRVIPVIDLKGGMAVHAVGGRRDQYRPVRSVWQASASPIALAASLREGLGIERLYLADLDAIAGHPRDREVYERIIAHGIDLWLDAGVGDSGRLEELVGLDRGRMKIVIGLESVADPAVLAEIVGLVGPSRAIFSLDLDEGKPRTEGRAGWSGWGPHEIVARAIACGVGELIVLDLARVGTGRGIGTEDLLAFLRIHHPSLSVSVGGGIRGIDDVLRIRDLGASAVLVGSAILDGRIGRRELDRIAAMSA